MADHNRLSPRDRYMRDVEFKTIVDFLYNCIERCDYTPTELREAAMLAAIMHAERNPVPVVMSPTGQAVPRAARRPVEAPAKDCPECGCDRVAVGLRPYHKTKTAFDGLLTWYRCPRCKEKFVTRNDGDPAICTGLDTTP